MKERALLNFSRVRAIQNGIANEDNRSNLGSQHEDKRT